MCLRRWVYRIRQGLARLAVALRLYPLDEEPARQRLSPQAWALFARMPRGDQAHGLCVLARLPAQEAASPWLAEAALLHDVGKMGGRLSLPYRVAIVLLGSHVSRWASADPTSWRYPFHVHLHHAGRGAELCEQAGCDPRTVALVRWHGAVPDQELAEALIQDLEALRTADDRC